MNDITHCSCGEVLRSEACWLLHRTLHPQHYPVQVDKPKPPPEPTERV